jgi:phage terminase large subunit-like protein
MAAHAAKIEAGHVHLPERAPWLGDFHAELLAFPAGASKTRSIAFHSSSPGATSDA